MISSPFSTRFLVALNIFSNSEFIRKACITMSSGSPEWLFHPNKKKNKNKKHAKTNIYEKMYLKVHYLPN